MSDIELVIKIPEEYYKRLVYMDLFRLREYIENGIVLPKGHGRIGDLDALRNEVSSWGMNDYEPSDFIDEIDRVDTIIPADVEGDKDER